MKKSICLMVGVFVCSIGFAATPTSKEIISTLTNLDDSYATPKNAIDINKTQAVRLKSGEVAYLSGVEFQDAGRNFWGGYILTRPKLKQSQILEYGGQANRFKIYNAQAKSKPIQLVQLTSASSGQGEVSSRDDLVYFDGWKAYVVATAESSSYPGRYSEKLGEEDCKTGENIESTLKVVAEADYVLRTSKTSNACKGAKVTIKEDKIPFKIR
ncbi:MULTISPECIES: hypothetical protein [unclassified Acinetobacter]|uniref:hypothetical protein n=1 Tax=unclassified Acinetobacter TaxID=196816 RepID=UPI002576D153|nr:MULTISPECIES: hypothetical protein [unclassified Acinetobacter]